MNPPNPLHRQPAPVPPHPNPIIDLWDKMNRAGTSAAILIALIITAVLLLFIG